MLSNILVSHEFSARIWRQLLAHLIYYSLTSDLSIEAAHTTEEITAETEEIMPNSSYTGRDQKEIENIFKKHGIIPDLIDDAPQYELNMRYAGAISPDFGTKHRPEELKFPPFAIRFETIPHVMYSLFMFDLDSPLRKNATKRPYVHWSLVNIPNYSILHAETLVKYIGPSPEKGTGLHRYVFLIYQQPYVSYFNYTVSYTEPRLLNSTDDPQRANWDIRKIAKKYKLEGPVAGNFLYCEWTPQSEDT
nr:PREDICTED: protein D3-like isoform X2 [Bemisia tabaci]XP_018913584.1 PREDICTED: protein D3-like isoform X2 [Bemisia tabaci]XP_018913585.1 PREDICTED: protein D3-like isoform X2 [Bemisia tabaci]